MIEIVDREADCTSRRGVDGGTPRTRCLAAAVLAAVVCALAAPGRAAEIVVELAFEGAGGGHPPDTMGAVGPEHVVEITNELLAIHRRSDGAVLASMPLWAFWDAAGVPIPSSTGDPRILYDQNSQRFFVVGLANAGSATSQLLLAVSHASDPGLGFTGFAIDSDSTDATWADFPTIGVDADAVIIASDMVRIGSGSNLPQSVDVLVVPKADLVAPAPSIARATLFQRAPLATTGIAPQPVIALDGSGMPSWLLSSAGAFLGVIQTALVGGDPMAPTLAKGPLLRIEPLGSQPEAADPGGGELDTGDGHFASPVRIAGSLWATHTTRGAAGRAAIRWIELDPDTLAVRQEGLIEDPALDFLYPSIAANGDGCVVIGFSASSADRNPSVFAALGETARGVTRFGTPVEVLRGARSLSYGSGTVAPFGDYSATVADPSDPRLFWTFQEFGGETSVVGIAALRVVPEPAPVATDLFATFAFGAIARRVGRRKRTGSEPAGGG